MIAEMAGGQGIARILFENLGQAEDKYFAAGISDEINGRLASVGRSLSVDSAPSRQKPAIPTGS